MLDQIREFVMSESQWTLFLGMVQLELKDSMKMATTVMDKPDHLYAFMHFSRKTIIN